MDGALQDLTEVIEAVFQKWQEGYNVVYVKRVKRVATLFLQAAYKVSYRVFRAASYIAIALVLQPYFASGWGNKPAQGVVPSTWWGLELCSPGPVGRQRPLADYLRL